MDERWLLPRTADFYVRSEDILDVTWEERPDELGDRFAIRVTFVHPSIASKQFDSVSWSEIVAFSRRGVRVTKAVAS